MGSTPYVLANASTYAARSEATGAAADRRDSRRIREYTRRSRHQRHGRSHQLRSSRTARTSSASTSDIGWRSSEWQATQLRRAPPPVLDDLNLIPAAAANHSARAATRSGRDRRLAGAGRRQRTPLCAAPFGAVGAHARRDVQVARASVAVAGSRELGDSRPSSPLVQGPHEGGHYDYEDRSSCTGFMRLARREGSQVATIPITTMIRIGIANARHCGSKELPPPPADRTSCCRPHIRPRPRRRPAATSFSSGPRRAGPDPPRWHRPRCGRQTPSNGA